MEETPGTDGAMIALFIEGTPNARRKVDRKPALELVEIGLTWVDVHCEPLEDARRGACLRNACTYIRRHGGTLMLGRFHNLDLDTSCCHAWVLTDDGRHVDPSPVLTDGVYFGAPDPHGWAQTWNRLAP